MKSLVGVCRVLLCTQAFQSCKAYLSSVEELPSLLFGQLLPALQASTTALQLQSDQLSGRSEAYRAWDWVSLANCAASLDSLMGFGPVQQLLVPAADDSGITATALQLLQSSCQLLLSMPLDCPSGMPAMQHACLLMDATSLSFEACRVVGQSVKQQREQARWRWGARAQQLTQLLLRTLQRVPAWLDQLGKSPAERAAICSATGGVPNLLVHLALTNPIAAGGGPIDDVPGVLSWCAGAVAALRSLQPLAALVPQQERPRKSAAACADSLWQLAGTCSWISGRHAMLSNPSWLHQLDVLPAASPAQKQELITALFSLHTTACRAAHWAAQEGSALLPEGWWHELLPILSAVMFEAWQLDKAAGRAVEQPTDIVAMAAAHWRAVDTLLGSPGRHREVVQFGTDWAAIGYGLVAAAAACPPAAALGPAALEMLDCVLKSEVGLRAGLAKRCSPFTQTSLKAWQTTCAPCLPADAGYDCLAGVSDRSRSSRGPSPPSCPPAHQCWSG